MRRGSIVSAAYADIFFSAVNSSQVALFRWSSLRRFTRSLRASWLVGTDLLSQVGLVDSRNGWSEYTRYFIELAGDAQEQEPQGFSQLETGWAIEAAGWRQALARTFLHRALEQGIARSETAGIKETRWQNALDYAVAASGKTAAGLSEDAEGAHWKIRMAQRLRRQFSAPQCWIALQLNVGTPEAVRVNVALLR